MKQQKTWPGSDSRGGTINDLPSEAPRTPAVSTPTSYRDTTRIPGSRQGELEGARVLWISGIFGLAFILLIALLLFINMVV